MQAASATAPGKIILFGEHAVVYGQPAIAVPLTTMQVTVVAEPVSDGEGLVITAPDVNRTVRLSMFDTNDPLYNALGLPVRLVLERFGIPEPPLRLTVRSTIPIASGLGSGAALATALIRAIGLALECPLANDDINTLVFEVEKRHHGTPSGIDNTVIVYEQPVYYVRGQPLETLNVSRPFTVLVADSGQESPTHVAVGDVRRLYASDRATIGAIFARIGNIATVARTAIETGAIESLGPLMNENHTLLSRLTVSSTALDRLCSAARDAGAYGAKLSGGGRGGNIIALVDETSATRVADALHRVGALRVVRTVIG